MILVDRKTAAGEASLSTFSYMAVSENVHVMIFLAEFSSALECAENLRTSF